MQNQSKYRISFVLWVVFATFGMLDPVWAVDPEILPDEEETRKEAGFRDRLWVEVYSENEFSTEDDNNLISESWVKIGAPLVELGPSPLELYLKVKPYWDLNGDFWNNRVEFGPGVRYMPFPGHGLFLFAEVLRGEYSGRESEDRNPDEDGYWDLQAGFAYWTWMGDEAWQIDGARFYAPFTGWREIYADGLYYDRDDNNFIATLDWKEGLLLAQSGGVSMDAYLALEAGVDTNRDYWNNYLQGGPGLRFVPFDNLDLKISLEYFAGDYYRGGSDMDSDDITDFRATAAIWHRW